MIEGNNISNGGVDFLPLPNADEITCNVVNGVVVGSPVVNASRVVADVPMELVTPNVPVDGKCMVRVNGGEPLWVLADHSPD